MWSPGAVYTSRNGAAVILKRSASIACARGASGVGVRRETGNIRGAGIGSCAGLAALLGFARWGVASFPVGAGASGGVVLVVGLGACFVVVSSCRLV